MKKNTFLRTFLFFMMLSTVSIPFVVHAQTTTSGSSTATTSGSSAGGFNIAVPIFNPIGVDTIEEAIKKIMDVVVTVSIPIIVVMFIWSGFLYIFAQGDPNALKKAHNMFLYTVFGALLILGAWTIAAAIVGTVNLITG